MKSFIVFPLFLVLTVAEEQRFHNGHDNSQLGFAGDPQPEEMAVLEEQLLENEMNQPITHLGDDRPHPHRVHQDHLHSKRTSAESFPQIFEEEESFISAHNPVPDPHLVEGETHHKNHNHNNGTGRENTHHHHHHRHGSLEVIHHNAVENPIEKDEESWPGTEASFNEELFEHHPNTGVPDLEPTVGTESGTGFELVEEPVVLPVTEGKNRNQDPVVQYGLPKELMPIHPGGGSRFEDLEREKLEKKKMAQTKGGDDDTENGASHEAEGLYSSAATLCLSFIIFSLTSSFRLIV